MQTFHQERLEAVTDDKFGTAATDIHHQPGCVIRQGMGHAEVDQARLFTAGNDLYGIADNRLGTAAKLPAIAGNTQGIGAHHPHITGIQHIQRLAKTRQAFKAAPHSLVTEHAALHARGQLDVFTQPLNGSDLAMLDAGYHHMEAVGTQVYGGDQSRTGRGVLLLFNGQN